MTRVLYLAVLATLCLAAAVPASAQGLQLALARAQQTGLPLLVLGTTESCVHCRRLKERLATEPQLQNLLSQYVPLELKVGDPDFRTWATRYRPTGNGVPMIFIVAADGKEIYNKSGAPQGDALPQLLEMGIRATGGIKTPPSPTESARDARKLAALARRIERLLADGDTEAAVRMLASQLPAGKPSETAAPDGPESQQPPAEAVPPELAELLNKIQQQAENELTQAREKANGREVLVSLVQTLRIQRVYGALPGMDDAARQATEELAGSESDGNLLEQARMIDAARAYEEKNNSRAALAAYQKVVDKFPDSRAAELCLVRIRQLSE